MMSNCNNFNIRVYGVLINESNQVLVTDERRGGKEFTKFVGGGLEFGEGTVDCLKREFDEELRINIEVKEHFYTTDYFQQSAFNRHDQLISIYYLVHTSAKIETSVHKFDFPVDSKDAQKFRWINAEKMNSSQVDFPIDKKVANKIKEIFGR